MTRQGAKRERTVENVKDFWNKEAEEWGDNPRVTIRDHFFRLHEIDLISEIIRGRHNALDIGCGTGFSTCFYSEVVPAIIGADYAEGMISFAQQFLDSPEYLETVMAEYGDGRKPKVSPNLCFEGGNILELKYAAGSFDAVIVERVLINLPTREFQAQAVREIARVLGSNGICALMEVTLQGHQGVDEIRTLFEIPILEKYWHNLYLDESEFEAVLAENGLVVEEIQRPTTYQFLSKVVHPLIVAPKEPRFLDGFNKAARLIARAFPTYESVIELGLEPFLRREFRTQLEHCDPEKLQSYDRALPQILEVNPGFQHCSHQVLYTISKDGK